MFITDQLYLYISFILVLFVPGYFLLKTIFGTRNIFFPFEKWVLSLGLSIPIVNFLMILMSRMQIPLNKLSVLGSIVAFSLINYGIFLFLKSKNKYTDNISKQKPFFSKRHSLLIVILLFLTVLIKTIFLANTIFPTSTDLGHHMYWSKLIVSTEQIPIYQESDVIEIEGNYSISEPEHIADFIIGEHLIFSAISILSGADFVSYFPPLVLFILNISAILSLFLLSIYLFKSLKYGKVASILVLFFSGPIYALSSPQAKYISGGVVGNTLGNFFIPIIIYLIARSLKERKAIYLSLSLFIELGLAYTHHLSTFVFIFVLLFSLGIFIIFNFKNVFNHIKSWISLFWNIKVLTTIAFGVFMILYVYTPSYLNFQAVDTAVGTPIKSTRTGMSFAELMFSSGEARMILGVIGLSALLFFSRTRKTYEGAILIGWALALLTMSLKPQILYVDIPSNRIATYSLFPLVLLSAFAIAALLQNAKNHAFAKKYVIPPSVLVSTIIILITFSLTSGYTDNSQSLSAGGNHFSALQTFHASQYLANTIKKEDIVLKDHNYITADAWIKLFFMRGYNFPLSRAYFKRYNDPIKDREMCTLWMISAPHSENGQKCYKDLSTDYVMVDPYYDSTQFKKGKSFWQVYTSNKITIFKHNE